MIIIKFVLGPIENNNYLLIDDSSDQKEAILIDCTEKSDAIDEALVQNNANLKYILLTHGHFDHILGINYYRKKYGCKALVHKDDKYFIDNIKEFASRFGVGEVEVQNIDGFVDENDSIKFGNIEVKVIYTPGHTQGGVCYLIGDDIFTGDTLFYESVGRTDLPGGNFNQIKTNIQEKLFTLDDNIKVYPGHGPATTIGHERINNQFI